MQLLESDRDSKPQGGPQGIDVFCKRCAHEIASPGSVTIEKLPNEVLFNVMERLQDNKAVLYNCLLVSKRWYDLALRHLWHHFEICLSNRQQMRMLESLIVNQSSNDKPFESAHSRTQFPFVRSLHISISLQGERVSKMRRCVEIAEDMTRCITFLQLCTGLRSLRIDLHPFVQSDAHFSQWDRLQSNNLLMMDLVQVAASKEYAELFLDVAQSKWRFEESLSSDLEQYIHALQGQITRLHVSETASTVWSWFRPLTRLKRIDFENMGNPGEEALAKFWNTLAQFPLEELKLAGINFPRATKFKNWQTLRSIRLNQFGDVEGACSTILRTFPNLHTLAFNNPSAATSASSAPPINRIVCTNLRQIIFTRCQAPKNIISLIAKACPFIQTCMPPDNASDEDIITLIDSCRFLTTLLIDCCTDLTSMGIASLPRAKRLRSLMFNFQHLVYLDEECIFALAENCVDLHSRGCRIATVGQKNEKFQRVMLREKLQGTARFKRWFIRFVAWRPDGPFLVRMVIDIDEIRREMDGDI